jgi:hypothetical protein
MIPLQPFSEDEEQVVKEFFSPEGSQDPPLCFRCSEELDIVLDYRGLKNEMMVRVSCPGCTLSFDWHAWRPMKPWKPLHLAYFRERLEIGETLRCPYDDCLVSFCEYSDGRVEFRCPFCNRRSKIERDGKVLA